MLHDTKDGKPEAKQLIDTWHEEQIESALEGDDVAQILVLWISRSRLEPSGIVSRTTEPSSFIRIANSNSMGGTSWEGKPQWLGTRLQRSISSYRRRFGLEIVTDKHTKSNRYRFAPTEEQLSLLRTKKPTDPARGEFELEFESKEEMP